MLRKIILGLLFCIIFSSPVYAVRSLPPGVQPERVEGEAVGDFPELRGSGKITFVNTGGEARLVTVCGDMTGTGANSVNCTGIDVEGTFTGGPNGVAFFKTSGGEIKLQLSDGKVFSFSSSGISMNFTVTDPSIFDDWVENVETRDSGARMSNINGQLEIACPPDLEAWDVMKMGRVILVDCHLRTGEDSTAVISFSDMTSFEMKPETEIVIDTPPRKDSKWKLLMGNIWVNVKKMIKDGTMEVHTSQAVAGIKGTRFMLTETGTESKIEVTEGTVAFKSKANGKEVKVSAGETVTATKNGLSEKTMLDTPEKKSFGTNNLSPKTIYLTGDGLVVLILVVIGVAFLKKR